MRNTIYILICILFSFCTNKPAGVEQKVAMSTERELIDEDENFELFLEKFCSDKEFQISRIKFPVGEYFEVIEDCSPESKYYDEAMGECIRFYQMTPDNWDYFSMEYFKQYPPEKWDDMLLSITGLTDDQKDKNKTRIFTDWDTRVDFKKYNKKWYLVKFFIAVM